MMGSIAAVLLTCQAGTFGPNELDNTFAPRVDFTSVPPGMRPNRPPSDGLRFFGLIKIGGETEMMTVRPHDLTGKVIYSLELAPDV